MPAAPIPDAACPTSPGLLIEMICPGASFTLCTFMPRSSPARPLPQQIGIPRKWYSTACNLTTEVAVLLTLYVALAATDSDRAWQILRRQHGRK